MYKYSTCSATVEHWNSQVRTPVLYVYGARDAQLGRRALERFRLVPGVELQEVPRVVKILYTVDTFS